MLPVTTQSNGVGLSKRGTFMGFERLWVEIFAPSPPVFSETPYEEVFVRSRAQLFKARIS